MEFQKLWGLNEMCSNLHSFERERKREEHERWIISGPNKRVSFSFVLSLICFLFEGFFFAVHINSCYLDGTVTYEEERSWGTFVQQVGGDMEEEIDNTCILDGEANRWDCCSFTTKLFIVSYESIK